MAWVPGKGNQEEVRPLEPGLRNQYCEGQPEADVAELKALPPRSRVPCAQPPREAWCLKGRHLTSCPCLCWDLTLPAFSRPAGHWISTSTSERGRKDTSVMLPQSISELRGTVPRHHWALQSHCTPTHSTIHNERPLGCLMTLGFSS